ncbi:hypothetical protein [Methanobrevibacter sp. DSM 116169]|uniref:hypothetical protein n=1 Tax=Methanobrevibacter sp. DSM 116169 TaxID=3242727 RepID=UPI0038FC3BB0
MMELLGKCPQIKVIDYLLAHPFGEYTKQQIAVGSGISRSTLDNFINVFIENDLILIKNKKYLINKKSPLIHNLDNVQRILAEIQLKKELENYDETKMEKYSDEELDEIFDENAPDIDLNKMENEIEKNEDVIVNKHELEKLKRNYNINFTNYSQNNMEVFI